MPTREECIAAAGRQYAIALTDPVEAAALDAYLDTQTSCPPAPGVRADKTPTPTTHQRRTA